MIVYALVVGSAGCGDSESGQVLRSDGASGGSGGDGGAGSGGDSRGGSAGEAPISGESSSGGSGGNGASIPLDEYASALAEATCALFDPCCQERYPTFHPADCVEPLSASIAAEIARADPSLYSYDPEAARSCVRTTQTVFENSGCKFDDPRALGLLNEACGSVFTGTLEPGESCASPQECRTGPDEFAECTDTFSENENEEVCIVSHRAVSGEECFETCRDLGGGLTPCQVLDVDPPARQGRCFTRDGLYCSKSGVCEAQLGLGSPCTDDHDCSEGYCSTTTNQCAPKKAEAAECLGHVECAEDLYCSANTGCTRMLDGGVACVDHRQCRSALCVDDVCADYHGGGYDRGLAIRCTD